MGRTPKTPKDFISSNEQYVKLREGSTDDATPRETPDSQGPGKRGYSKPEFETWTTEELRLHAAELGIDEVDSQSREALIESIASRRPPASRTR